MCNPCGPRRSYYYAAKSSYSTNKTRISKREVEKLIYSGDYECFYRMASDSSNQPYDGCTNNLVMILHDGETKVKVAGKRSPDYIEGYMTIIMNAKCFPAVILLRSKL